MSLKFRDRVMETTSSSGTADFVLSGKVNGFQRFNDTGNFVNGDTLYYCAFVGTQWEAGLGTYVASTNKIARPVAVASNSLGNTSPINFTSAPQIICTYTAEAAQSIINATANKILLSTAGGLPIYSSSAISLAGDFATSGAYALTLTSTGSTNVTLPTTGTLATLAGSEAFTNKTINASLNALSNLTTSMFAASVVDTDPLLTAASTSRIPSQSAIKSYVDNIATGLSWKPSVACATTSAGGNIVLSGEQTIDGVLTSASRVLVKNQSDQTTNGIYISSSGAWVRAPDDDAAAELLQATVFVRGGTLHADTQWTCTNDVITLGVTNITFAQVSGAGTYSVGTNLVLTGNQFSLATAVAITSLALGGATPGSDALAVTGTSTFTGNATFTGSGSTTLTVQTSANNNCLVLVKTNGSIRGYVGWTTNNSGTLGLYDSSGVARLSWSSTSVGVSVGSGDAIAFSSTSAASSTVDTGISRISAGLAALGNGTAADFSGSLKATALWVNSLRDQGGTTKIDNTGGGQVQIPTGQRLQLHSDGAASASTLLLDGAVFAAGTGTTNFPHILLQPTGTTAATTWSTAGTGLGMNLVSGFAGNFVDMRIAGGSGLFVVNSAGAISSASLATLNGGTLQLRGGGISAAAWTTSGKAIVQTAATWTDTSSSGTVAAVYINAFLAPTFAFSSATTVTNAFGTYFVDPIAGTSATLSNKWALGADSIFSGGNIQLATTGALKFGSRTTIQAPADGNILFQNNAGTDFTRLQFGGTTASFPSIKRNAAAINFRLADDSADAAITAAGITASGNVNVATGYVATQAIRDATATTKIDITSNGFVDIVSGQTLRITSTTADQMRLLYDGSNYATFTAGSTGTVTIGGAGTGASSLVASGGLVGGPFSIGFYNGTALQMASTNRVAWTSGAINASMDTGLSRISAGLIGVGNGTAGDFSGSLKATGVIIASNSTSVGVATLGLNGGTTNGFRHDGTNAWFVGSGIDAIRFAGNSIWLNNDGAQLRFGTAIDARISRVGAASLQLGDVDAATTTAQIFGVQSVLAGNANVAGSDWTEIASRSTGTGLAGNRIFQASFQGTSSSSVVTITNNVPGTVNWTAHGLVPGSTIQFTTTGTLPTGLSLATNYYVIATGITADTFRVAATPGGAALTTSNGSGTHTATTQTTAQNPATTIATFGPSALTGSQTTNLLTLNQSLNTSGLTRGLLLSFVTVNVAAGSDYFRIQGGLGGTTQIFNVSIGGDARAQNTFGLAAGGDGQWSKTNFSQISTAAISWVAGTNATASADTTISRNAAGVVQIGTTANNALGTLLLAGLTASGTVIMSGLPTADPHVVGQLWRNSGVLTVSAG